MKIDDLLILKLRGKVKAAREIFDLAISFCEAWKPTSLDENLKNRMGTSRATNTFSVISFALRREMLLSLMRFWDNDRRAVGMKQIIEILNTDQIIPTLAADLSCRIGATKNEIELELINRSEEVTSCIAKYLKHGSHCPVLESLKTLRDKRLAHYETDLVVAETTNILNHQIEEFFHDMTKIVELLFSIVEATSYNPEDSAKVHRRYAALFWASVRGERTVGHPDYRPVPVISA